MLRTISNLPSRYNIFTPKNYAIYVRNDHSVHLMPEIKKKKKKKLVVELQGTQINNTDLLPPLKAKYRELELNLMIEQLSADPKKIPQTSRYDMTWMLAESLNSLKIDLVNRFKVLWVTNVFDGSEYYLVSDRIIALVVI